MLPELNVSDEIRHTLESQAFERTLDLSLDNQLTDTIAHLPEDVITEAPWLR